MKMSEFFSMSTYHFIVLPTLCENTYCSHPHPHLLSFYVNFSHSGKCIVISLCGFNLTFPDNNDVEHLRAFWQFIYLLYEVSLKNIGLICKNCSFKIFQLKEFFIYAGYQYFLRYMFFIFFFPCLWLAYLFSS